MGISGLSLSSCSSIYCHKGGYTSIEEPNSIWPDWFNFVPALSSVPLFTTPPVASVHYLRHWLYVVVECSHVSSKRAGLSPGLCRLSALFLERDQLSPVPPTSQPTYRWSPIDTAVLSQNCAPHQNGAPPLPAFTFPSTTLTSNSSHSASAVEFLALGWKSTVILAMSDAGF